MSDNTSVDLDKLTTPFPPQALKQRVVGGGKSLTYVEGHVVIHRLNDATGNHWDFKVLNISVTAAGMTGKGVPQSLYTATVELCIPGLGCRQQVGVQMFSENAGEDLVKGAVTDGLKKAATLFGVGLELYGPDYEAGEVQKEPFASIAGPVNRVPAQPYRPPEKSNYPAPAANRVSNGNNGPTPAQRNFMNGLAKDLGWVVVGPDGESHHNPEEMDLEVNQLYPGKNVDTLTVAEASELINQWKQKKSELGAQPRD